MVVIGHCVPITAKIEVNVHAFPSHGHHWSWWPITAKIEMTVHALPSYGHHWSWCTNYSKK